MNLADLSDRFSSKKAQQRSSSGLICPHLTKLLHTTLNINMAMSLLSVPTGLALNRAPVCHKVPRVLPSQICVVHRNVFRSASQLGCNAPGVEAPSRPAKDAAPRTSSPERFIDVSSLLSDFNPLKESHLVRWSDSDDEYDAMIETVELPQAWEEGEGAPQAPVGVPCTSPLPLESHAPCHHADTLHGKGLTKMHVYSKTVGQRRAGASPAPHARTCMHPVLPRATQPTQRQSPAPAQQLPQFPSVLANSN